MRAMVAAGLMCVAGAAGAQGFFTGNRLNSACENDKYAVEFYMVGAFDTSVMFSGLLDDGAKKVCLPEGVNSTQIRDVVCRYTQENPKDRHWPAAIFVWEALTDAFPCPDQ